MLLLHIPGEESPQILRKTEISWVRWLYGDVGEITGSEAFKIPVLTMMYHWLNPTCLDDDVTAYTAMNIHIKLLTILRWMGSNAIFLILCGG